MKIWMWVILAFACAIAAYVMLVISDRNKRR